MWNVVGNDGVKYGGLLWCGIWWRTLMWNAPENGYVECSRERLREIWWRTVMLGCNA